MTSRQVVVGLGVGPDTEVIGVGVFKGETGSGHAPVGLAEIGVLPTDALEHVAPTRGDVVVSHPESCAAQQVELSFAEVGRQLRPEPVALSVCLQRGGRDVLIEEERGVDMHFPVSGENTHAEAGTLGEERLDAGVEG